MFQTSPCPSNLKCEDFKSRNEACENMSVVKSRDNEKSISSNTLQLGNKMEDESGKILGQESSSDDDANTEDIHPVEDNLSTIGCLSQGIIAFMMF